MVSAERNRDHLCVEGSILTSTSILTATRSGRPPPWQGPRGPPSTVVWPTGEQGEGRHTHDAADDPSRALRLKERSLVMGGAVSGGAWAWEAGVGPDVCRWLAGEAAAAGDADEDHWHAAGLPRREESTEAGASDIDQPLPGAGVGMEGVRAAGAVKQLVALSRPVDWEVGPGGAEAALGIRNLERWGGFGAWGPEPSDEKGDPGLEGGGEGEGPLRRTYPFFLEDGWD
jgi:hypothetical protein